MVEHGATVEIDGGHYVPVSFAIKSFTIAMTTNVGPFNEALRRLSEGVTLARSGMVSFTVALRQNRRELRRLLGVPESRPRRGHSPRRRKHAVIRRRLTRSQTRRVRSARTR